MSNTTISLLNLQLFADGGADGSGTGEAGATQGVNATAAVSQSGVNGEASAEEVTDGPAAEVKKVDRNKAFEALIKGDYKDLYDQRVQDTIQKRLKASKDIVDKYGKLSPMLEMLSNKYGVDANDVDALNKAIEDDDTYYEQEALEKGMSVEQLKEVRKMERENSELKRRMQEIETQENANRLYKSWISQAEEVKALYPAFELNDEIQNRQFEDLLRANVPVRTAYEVVHKDELIPAAMQYTAKVVEEKMANKVRANGARPTENGTSAQSATLTKSDVSQLSKSDMAEINRRVAMGERVTF